MKLKQLKKVQNLSTMISELFNKHVEAINKGFASLNQDELSGAAIALHQAFCFGDTVFVCGNGASASIAQHMACDFTKGTRNDEKRYFPKVVSLSANIPLMTAIANDIDYNEVYSYQLESMAKSSDTLVVISSSGNSPNIIRAIEAAQDMGMLVIAFTGFDGGKARELADIKLHVDVPEYEATEDCHQAIMQLLAKICRKAVLSEDL